MYVFRIRDYSPNQPHNSNCAERKLEAVSEELAQRDGGSRIWIYFFTDLTPPKAL